MPLLFWLAGVGALSSVATSYLHGSTLVAALLAVCPFLLALACASFASPRWAKGWRGLLLGLPMAVAIPYQLYLALAVPPDKWVALQMLWSSQVLCLALALWWLMVAVLGRVDPRRAGRIRPHR